MWNASEYFNSINEPFASGFFEARDRSKFYRFALGYTRYLERCPLPEYTGGQLYPTGMRPCGQYAIQPDYSYSYMLNGRMMAEKCSPEAIELVRSELDLFPDLPSPHWVGGQAYCHSFPNYGRIEAEGLNSYRERVLALEEGDFRDGLLCLLDGIDCYRRRCLEVLRAADAPETLIAGLEKVPFEPAETLYEAVLCRNFIFTVDFCDEPGRMDQEWIRYYQGEDAVELLKEFFENVDSNSSWSGALGPDYNPLTLQMLEAVRGKRRPSLELRVTPDMPDDIWAAAARAIRDGSGSPNFYNEPLYQQELARTFPDIPAEDRIRFNGGGCTETMLAGVSRVGSLDAGINTALVLRDTISKALPTCETFEQFYEALRHALQDVADEIASKLDAIYNARIAEIPQPMRTLLIDDCIDNAKDFNAGGARYNWGVINYAGMINVIESLLAIRDLVYEKKVYAPAEFVALLDHEDETLYARLKKCPHYGVDDERADALAADVSEMIFHLFDGKHSPIGTCYLASSIQFTTYADAGKHVGPTPDGRRSGEPLNDSLCAIHGNDSEGPTALLNSVAKLKLSKALGTPVLNLSLSPEHVETALKPLVQAFFRQGGMQVQITCVSREDMIDALEHPERHNNLIVRVGGYAEYFNRLSDDLKRAVIARTVQI